MKYTEKLTWILDKHCESGWNEETSRQNIDFVHSLGLKCDCVGWSELDLASPRALEILDAVDLFCRENDWGARGYYERTFAETQSSWYALNFSEPKGNFTVNRRNVPADDGGTVNVCTLKPYCDLKISPKEFWGHTFVPERFRDACIRAGIEEVDFCWAEDIGKYEAEQYFHIYPRHAVSSMATNRRFYYSAEGQNKLDPTQDRIIRDLGGYLPRLAETFYRLDVILPRCYLATELPKAGVSSAYIAGWPFAGGSHYILIHRDTAALLLKEKGLLSSWLLPVPVLDEFPAGYEILPTGRRVLPAAAYREEMLQKYKKLKSTPRPIYGVSEKEALKLLRQSKKERTADFQKAMSKSAAQALLNTDYSPMLPYYRISNGCFLSDEHELLPHARALYENDQFHRALQAEELLKEIPQGVVIAKCPDGDNILLCRDGIVLRFSHEAPEIIEQWPTLEQYIVEALQE